MASYHLAYVQKVVQRCKFCVVKKRAAEAAGAAGSRHSYDVIGNLPLAVPQLCCLLCWLHSQWSLHVGWPLVALGLYLTSLAAPVD